MSNTITYNNKEIKLPFDDLDYSKKPLSMVTIKNIFSGEPAQVPQFAASVYDFINGCQMTGNYKHYNKALDWFRKHFPEQYMVLLD